MLKTTRQFGLFGLAGLGRHKQESARSCGFRYGL